VRGSGSNNNVNRVSDETINTKNSFNVLSNDGDDTDDIGGINVNDEFESKFHLDPIIEDDEGDVESDVEGIAMDMKPEFDVNAVNESEINTATCDDVSNGV
nr:hypothetical protein [Tanacetum cinerariifolium]